MTEKIFNVTRNDEGKVIGIEFNAEAFIIPNSAGKITDFWTDSAAEETKEMATNVLGEEPNDDESYIQMWYVAKDLGCDNLVDHSAWVDIDGEEYRIRMDSSYLPYTALKGKNDGDTIDVSFISGRREWDKTPEGDIEVLMHVTLNQKDYRYRRFGSFEETLMKVI